ncbi:MAG: aminotransferase class I/II-fold pyridoxal phosphate-dependent enzyme [Anaerolineales bacterium]|nr:aminotransferase class I/II-fold pyridoxal phosphate-dependent enzyme [Anaerolineales bacterium]
MPDHIREKIEYWRERVSRTEKAGLYFFNQPVEEILAPTRVRVHGREMLQLASYSYLGLLGHPHINAAAQAAVEKYGTGTHGVRLLAGTLKLHDELEAALAAFTGREAAITFSSGYNTNLAAITTLVGRHDAVISDKLNHASLVDGCFLSGAELLRFKHRDLADLERCLRRAAGASTKLVVVDAVFSMDGDVIALPAISALCRAHGAWLMVDEAHSLGVLGATGRGIEEHFGVQNLIDLKMGTLSKTIPSVGGYLAASKDLIHVFRHAARPFIFSAALPPAQAAAALAAVHIIEQEPERVAQVQTNARYFCEQLRALGFNTLNTETAIVPIVCGSDERAYEMVRACQQNGVFALPVISPAVPEGLARLRATVTAAHTRAEIDCALEVLERAGRAIELI